jgi:hypothetical protein
VYVALALRAWSLSGPPRRLDIAERRCFRPTVRTTTVEWNPQEAAVRVTVTTELACTVADARELVMRPQTMQLVSWPLTMFAAISPPALPERWSPGRYRVRLRSLWVIPLGEQTINISFPPGMEPNDVRIRDNGSGRLMRRWDHLIMMRPTGDGARTLYTDQVDVDAGVLTVPVWAWAAVLYRWRQYRWRRLVRARPPT